MFTKLVFILSKFPHLFLVLIDITCSKNFSFTWKLIKMCYFISFRKCWCVNYKFLRLPSIICSKGSQFSKTRALSLTFQLKSFTVVLGFNLWLKKFSVFVSQFLLIWILETLSKKLKRFSVSRFLKFSNIFDIKKLLTSNLNLQMSQL